MVLKQAYNTVANYKCAIADLIRVYYDIDTNIQGISPPWYKDFGSCVPPQRGIMPKWDLSDVLEYYIPYLWAFRPC